MTDLERIARDIVFGGNLSNADAVLLWERLTGFKPRQAKQCDNCAGNGFLMGGYRCHVCKVTGYVGGFTPRDAEAQVKQMADAVKK